MTKENKISNLRRFSWGVIAAIVGALLLGVGAGAYWKEKDAASFVSFSYLNPARTLVEQKDMIINVQPLRDYLNSAYESNSNVSIYFEYLPTGANIALNKDAEFYPASLLKLPVAMAVAKKIERREWEWTNELVLLPADKDDGFGTLYKEPSNSTYTIEELVRRSLTESDNTAHFILVRNLEVAEMNDVYEHMGLDGFLKTNGNLSAKRYATIVRTLFNASYLSEANSQKLLSYMTQSPFVDYLQQGLPPLIPFAHKIGISESEGVYLDSGIVYAEHRPYLLTVMIRTKDEKRAKEIMADVSKRVYTYVSSYSE